MQVYPWGGFEEDEPGEQYFQNLPTSSASATPAAPSTSSAGDAKLRQPPPSLAPPSPPSPSPSPHLSNTDALGEQIYFTYVNIHSTETPTVDQLITNDGCLCLCNSQLHTTQVNAWPTPALHTPSPPVGSFTPPTSRHGSRRGNRHTASGDA